MTRATNAIGARLIDENLLLPREIQMKSASARAIVQAIAAGVTDPVEAVNRAPYYAQHRDLPGRQERDQRLVEALTALPDMSRYARHVLKALLKDRAHFERQCLISPTWMGVGKRIIRMSYHLLRTGKPYDGSQYNFRAHQTQMGKQLRQVAARGHDLADEIHASEVDETARAIATEAIHAFSSIAGIEGGFTLSANAHDDPVSELGFTTRICRGLQKAGINTLSMLWFRLIQGTLMNVEKFRPVQMN
jgi:hypothetical protein